MKKTTLITLILLSVGTWANAGEVVGKWRTIDDATKKPKSIVEIFKAGDELKGRVAELINPDEPNPVCKECSGDRKGQPIAGMEIIWSMKEAKAGEEWNDGKILDPKNGKTYGCKMKLVNNGDNLEVRGFLGFSLLGRTQTWERVK